MRAIMRRELSEFFNTMYGYAFLSLFLLLCGYFFSRANIAGGSGSLSEVYAGMNSLMVLLTPLLTMHLFTQERVYKTEPLLYSSPINASSIVLGKFFAACLVVLLAIASMWIYVLLLAVFGTTNVVETLVSQLGFLLLSMAFISIGVFISALTERPLYALALTVVVLVLFWMLDNVAANIVNPIYQRVLWMFSVFSAYSQFELGIVSPANLLYLLTFSAAFLFLACWVIEQRKDRRM